MHNIQMVNTMKRTCYIFLLFLMPLVISAQKQNIVNPVLVLEGNADYPAGKSGDVWLGAVGNTHAKVTINATHREVKKEALYQEEYLRYSIRRGSIALDDNSSDDEFDPAVGTNQKIEYVVTFHFQTYTRPNETSEWVTGSVIDEEVSKETNFFSVYAIPSENDYTIVKDRTNTYVGGPTRNFEVAFKKETGYPDGWEVTWKYDDVSSVNNPFPFAPTTYGPHTLKVTVTNKVPGAEKPWFTKEEETINLMGYDNPNTAKPDYDSVGVVSQYTYVGREVTYSASIPNEERYGAWKYLWNEATGTDVHTFTPNAAAVYSTVSKLQCYNPDDPSESWGDGLNHTFTLTARENPNNVNLDYVRPEGINIVTCKGKEPETVEYKVVDAATGEEIDANKYGKWNYQWYCNGELISSKYDATIEPKVMPADTYSVSLSLSCVNPGKDAEGDVWREINNIPVGNYYVFNEPDCQKKEIHYSEDDYGKTDYSMYVGQTFPRNSQDMPLYSVDGGFEGLDVEGFSGGWEVVWTLNGELLESDSWTPDVSGDNVIKLLVRNIVKYNSGEPVVWYDSGDDFTYNIKVYDKPDFNPNVTVEDEEFPIDDPMAPIDIVKNDKINLKFSTFGGDASSWIYVWTLNAGEEQIKTSSEASLQWTAVNTSGSGSQTYDVIGSLKNVPSGIIKGFQYEPQESFKRTIVVWNDFAVNESESAIALKSRPAENEKGVEYVMETCEGLNEGKETVNLECIGGQGSFWSMEWKSLDGQPNPTTKRDDAYQRRFSTDFLNLTPQTDGASKTYRYKVRAIYTNGDYEKKDSIYVAIIAWPKPVIKNVSAQLVDKPETETKGVQYPVKDVSGVGRQIDVNCYDGDKIQLSYTISGGKNEQGGQWTYKYDDSAESTIDYPTGSTSDYTAEKTIIEDYSGSAESVPAQHHLTIYHKYDGKYYTSNEDWFSSNIVINTNVYSKPALEPVLTDSTSVAKWGENTVDVYAGGYDKNNVKMVYTHNHGVSNGWTYEWYLDEQKQSDNVDTWTYVPSTDVVSQDKTIKVHVINSLPDGNKGLNKIFTYPIRVWRKAKFSEGFTLEDVNQNRDMTNGYLSVRSGNTIDGSVSPIQYGYNNNYAYQWTGVNNEVDHDATRTTWSTPVKVSSESPSKTTETHTYSLWMYNTGPYGKIWDGTHVQQTVEIYNKPATPTAIIQKGNGSSRTMIATASVSDQDLQGRDYYLVFGYTDANGQDHDFSSQQQKVPGQVRWSSQFSNQEEMSNAYVYAVWKYGAAEITSGKCMLTGVDEVYDTSTYGGRTRAILGGDGYDAIDEVPESNSCKDSVRGVYTLEGTRVGTTLSGLKSGMYIVVYANGVTNKIIVK